MLRAPKPRPSRPLAELILQEKDIGPLVQKATRLAEMTDAVVQLLPELAAEFRVANVRQDTVVVQATSTAVAAKLRMIAPRIKDRLEAIAGPVEAIRIQVRPEGVGIQSAQRRGRGRLPTAAAGERLQALAGRLEDPRLRKAVMSLAHKAKQR